MQLQAKGCQWLPEAVRVKGPILPWSLWREHGPANMGRAGFHLDFIPMVLILDFWPPDL